MCGAVFAQSRIPEFDKAKQIKLLESTREDVKKILADFKLDDDADENNESDSRQDFSTKNADIEITYSTGECSDESDDTDIWNVGRGKVTFVEISLNKPLKLKKLKYDISSFRNEQKYANVEDLYVYHNKDLGVAFLVNDGKIETIHLFPTNSYYSSLCENEEAEDTKEFYSKDSYFGNSKLENRIQEYDVPASVTNLALSASEIKIGCNLTTENKKCVEESAEISVTTTANAPENDVLTYNYTVSGGKIIGQGAKVVWDLRDVQPGIYTITAGVDDGCGVCGATVTKTVVVK